ncbi:MAG: hypothetical protein ABL958_20010 [Bdellovibrionia bacterium]
MKTLKVISALSLVVAIVVIVSSPANAMRWTPGDGSNIEDCRSGWYCTTSGWVNWGSSWDHFWGGWVDNIIWGN